MFLSAAAYSMALRVSRTDSLCRDIYVEFSNTLIRLPVGNGISIGIFPFCVLSPFPGKASSVHGRQRTVTHLLPFAPPASAALPVSNAAVAVTFVCW